MRWADGSRQIRRTWASEIGQWYQDLRRHVVKEAKADMGLTVELAKKNEKIKKEKQSEMIYVHYTLYVCAFTQFNASVERDHQTSV